MKKLLLACSWLVISSSLFTCNTAEFSKPAGWFFFFRFQTNEGADLFMSVDEYDPTLLAIYSNDRNGKLISGIDTLADGYRFFEISDFFIS